MTEDEMRERTKQFALRVMRLVAALPKDQCGGVIGHQLLRSGTSVGANYRSACRAKSMPDFIHKLGIVEEEADECCYWPELIIEGDLMKPRKVALLMKEADEFVRIVAASRITAKSKVDVTDRKSKIENRKSNA